MLTADVHRSFGFWLAMAVLFYFLLHLQSVFSDLWLDEGEGWLLFEYARGGSYGLWLTPLIAALPFATGYCADARAGFQTMMVIRAGRRKYVASKVLCTALTGGIALAGGTILFLALLLIKFPLGDLAEMSQMMSGDESGLFEAFSGGRFALYYGSVVLMQFLSGAFWATSALAFSAFVPNALFTLCFPLILYRLVLEMPEWLGAPWWLSLTMLADGTAGANYQQALVGGIAVFGALTLISAAIFAAAILGRERNA